MSYREKAPGDLLKSDPRVAGHFLDQLPLAERVEFIMRASARERQELILLTSHPEEVMALFPPEELFFTIKEIGAVDALPLIELATIEQIHFILDIDWWRKDRLRPQKVFEWLRLLFACSEDKVASWLNTVDFDLLVSLFKYFTRVFKVGEGEEEDAGVENIKSLPPFTVDGYFFVYFKESGIQETLTRVIEIAREINPRLYFNLMDSLIWDIKAESEERAYKWRQARLADYGVPVFHEALEIYRPPTILDISQLKKSDPSYGHGSAFEPTVPAPVYPLSVPKQAALVLKALAGIREQEVMDRIKREWAYVCNHVIMADVLDFDALKEIKKGINKTAQYLNIGLEYISHGSPERAGEILQTMPLSEIFRLGYAQAIVLKKKASFLINRGYLQRDLSPADEPWRSLLAGVLKRHPLYYDPFSEDRGDRESDYRNFATLAELVETRERLNEAELIGRLIQKCFPDYLKRLKGLPLASCNTQLVQDITWGLMLFTAVAHRLLGDDLHLWPLRIPELEALFPRLWAGRDRKKGRKLAANIKKEFEQTLIGLDFSPSSLEQKYINRYLNTLYKKIEEDMGFLDVTTGLDPRYIHVLLLEL